MKKLLTLTVLLLLIGFILASCTDPEDDHTHLFGEWTITQEPTCTEDGTITRRCSCGKMLTKVEYAIGHTPSELAIEVIE